MIRDTLADFVKLCCMVAICAALYLLAVGFAPT
jgi:hypothetical protein